MAISLRLAGPPTDADIVEFSTRNPGYQFERNAAGELVVTPTSASSGRCEAELIAQLSYWAKRDGTGVVFSSSTGFRLPDGSLLIPDGSWLRRERWDALSRREQRSFGPFCPDAVFEVVSPSDRLSFLRRKCEDYLANGARIAVLVDPARRSLEIYMPGQGVQVIEGQRSAAVGPVLPGFTLDLDALFDD
jgi:Uma2 family endonuclease